MDTGSTDFTAWLEQSGRDAALLTLLYMTVSYLSCSCFTCSDSQCRMNKFNLAVLNQLQCRHLLSNYHHTERGEIIPLKDVRAILICRMANDKCPLYNKLRRLEGLVKFLLELLKDNEKYWINRGWDKIKEGRLTTLHQRKKEIHIFTLKGKYM